MAGIALKRSIRPFFHNGPSMVPKWSLVLHFSHGYYHINFILQDTSISPQDSCAYPFFCSFGNQICYEIV